ncbi:MAG: hypothetical protein GY935_25340 [Gammaproteobacteria bacterium]|nr:hypothetical protein [Gammaproteobacteria bacterium]
MELSRKMHFGLIWILLGYLFAGSLSVVAGDEPVCGLAGIDRDFAEYERQAGRQQILKLQRLLRAGGYDPGTIDGLTGKDTDSALQRLCLDFGLDAYLGGAAPAQEDAAPTQQEPAPVREETATGEDSDDAEADKPPTELVLLLVRLIESSAAVSEKHPGWMTLVRTEMFNTWLQQEPAINLLERLDTSPDDWPQLMIALIESFPGRRPPPDDKLNEIVLSGGGCGCSRDFSAMVYGFYPHWLAGDKEQVVDFSLLDRIGFFALKLNQKGEIPDRLYWRKRGKKGPGMVGFISKAHKHRVKVDVGFFASDWQRWGDEAVDRAATNIVETVGQKFSNPNTHLLRKVLPLVEDISAVSADGVTLYFDRYQSGDSNQLLAIVEKVIAELEAANGEAELSLMLGRDFRSGEQYQIDEVLLRGLIKLLPDGPDKRSRIGSILIFLPEPTTRSKRQLRLTVENSLHGHERKIMLRKIVPIVMLNEDGIDVSQFEDDLIYFQDNFAGVGLWPLDLDQASEKIEEQLLSSFQVGNDDANYLGELFDRNFPAVCEFVCPNRWMFRAAFALLATLLVICVSLVLWNCRLREIYQHNFIYFLAIGIAGLLVYVISLVCDPVWEERVDNVVIIILLVIVGGFFWHYLRKQMQPPLP